MTAPCELDGQPDEEPRRSEPERHPRPQSAELPARNHEERREDDREDREVRQVRVDAGPANLHGHARLILGVEEEKRDRGRDDEGASRDRHAASHYTGLA